MLSFYRGLYRALIVAGRPFGGVRPRRLYDVLGRAAYPRPEYQSFRNRWGAELQLSHAFHIDRNILIFGCYDLDLHLALEALIKPGMICFDVGANLGEMTLHMARLCAPSGHVYAFEPVPHVRARLTNHVFHNNLSKLVTAYGFALSDDARRCSIHIPQEAADNQGLGSIVNAAEQNMASTEIETKTLDQFIEEEEPARIDLIKIDIQGAELKFLRGAKNTLKKYMPDLLMEVSPDDLKAAGTNSRELIEAVAAAGYFIHKMKRGKPVELVNAGAIKPDFSATNVYCCKRPCV